MDEKNLSDVKKSLENNTDLLGAAVGLVVTVFVSPLVSKWIGGIMNKASVVEPNKVVNDGNI